MGHNILSTRYVIIRRAKRVIPKARRAKLGQIQGGVAEGQPRFDKGGVAIIFHFLRVKDITF